MPADHATHGYGLKADFERRTAGIWPLNIGQVYTTLARLERDGLVRKETSEDQHHTWRLTDAGRAQLSQWYAAPVVADPPERDELAIKVLIAAATASEDVLGILQRQREATMLRLQTLTRHKVQADLDRDLAWLLLLDALVLKADAELRWLDLCEARLRARQSR